MGFSVGFGSHPRIVNQFDSATHDARPDENASNNCSEACSCSGLSLYGKRRPDGSEWLPDDLKDQAFGQNVYGPSILGTTTQITNWLAGLGNVPSMVFAPTEYHNYSDGLFDRMWQALKRPAPVWTAVWYVDADGVIWDGHHQTANGMWTVPVGHWRLAYHLTDTTVKTMDPGGGFDRANSWDEFEVLSRMVLVAPTIPVPGQVSV